MVQITPKQMPGVTAVVACLACVRTMHLTTQRVHMRKETVGHASPLRRPVDTLASALASALDGKEWIDQRGIIDRRTVRVMLIALHFYKQTLFCAESVPGFMIPVHWPVIIAVCLGTYCASVMILVQAIASFLPKITSPAPTDHDQLCLGVYKEENRTFTLVDVIFAPHNISSDKGVWMWHNTGYSMLGDHLIGLLQFTVSSHLGKKWV